MGGHLRQGAAIKCRTGRGGLFRSFPLVVLFFYLTKTKNSVKDGGVKMVW